MAKYNHILPFMCPYVRVNNTFLQISNFKKEVEESLKNNYYFSLIFVTFCMLLYHPYDFSISIDDISKLLIEHNYLPEDNCEYFLDHFIKSFSNKPIKKYQLSRIWDILDSSSYINKRY